MKLSKNKKFKLKMMFNLKYLECVMSSIFKFEVVDNEYSVSSLDVNFDNWKMWKINQGIREEMDKINEKKYYKIDGVANSTLYVPKEFVEKVFILGFLP